jgi:hypothetical protein
VSVIVPSVRFPSELSEFDTSYEREIVPAESTRIGTRITEGYRRSAYEDMKCDWKILCVIFVVISSDSSVLRSVATRQR